jgi:hypothetical protein
MIPPPAQRMMAERAGATVVDVAGSHGACSRRASRVSEARRPRASPWPPDRLPSRDSCFCGCQTRSRSGASCRGRGQHSWGFVKRAVSSWMADDHSGARHRLTRPVSALPLRAIYLGRPAGGPFERSIALMATSATLAGTRSTPAFVVVGMCPRLGAGFGGWEKRVVETLPRCGTLTPGVL